MPKTLCANLAPDPEILGPQSPLAFVRFSPPDDDFAEEIYYPTEEKKAFDERFVYNPRENVIGYDPEIESDIEANLPGNVVGVEVMGEIVNRKSAVDRSRILNNQLANIKHQFAEILGNDVRNTYTMRTIPHKDILTNSVHNYPNQGENDEKESKKRTELHTSFRQISKEQHIPQESIYYGPKDAFEGQRMPEVENDMQNDSETNEKYANDLNLIRGDEPGVYTEGGLVFVGDGSNDGKKRKYTTVLLTFVYISSPGSPHK